MVNGRGDYSRDKVILCTYGKGPAAPLPTEKYVFDLSPLRDPAGAKPAIFKGARSGLDPLVQDWIKVDPRVGVLTVEIATLVHVHMTMGETWLNIGFVDNKGRWIGPAVAEIVADTVGKMGFTVATRHFALDKEDC